MRIHYLQHVPFEGLGYIETWAKEKRHTLSASKFYELHAFPALNDVDWLIVLGGPMGAYDDDHYAWMKEEKAFIKKAIDADKIVIGICLGAQLIASVLGARVYQNPLKEIGWFPVQLTTEGQNHALLRGFEKEFDVFHWHGDTFDLPRNAVNLIQSEACKNQMFVLDDHVLGFQFHFEFTEEMFDEAMHHMRTELTSGKFIQSETEVITRKKQASITNSKLRIILDNLEAGTK